VAGAATLLAERKRLPLSKGLFLSALSPETFYVKPSIHQVWSVAEKDPQANLLSWPAGGTPAGFK
jgi:hypothetical protein